MQPIEYSALLRPGFNGIRVEQHGVQHYCRETRLTDLRSVCGLHTNTGSGSHSKSPKCYIVPTTAADKWVKIKLQRESFYYNPGEGKVEQLAGRSVNTWRERTKPSVVLQ